MESAEQQRNTADSCTQANSKLTELQEECASLTLRTKSLLKTVSTKEAELQVSKQCLKKLKVFNDGKASKDKLCELLDVIKVRADLASTSEECTQVQGELAKRTADLEAYHQIVEDAQRQVQLSKQQQDAAQEEKNEAMSKLEVLASYFQEKEAQLNRFVLIALGAA